MDAAKINQKFSKLKRYNRITAKYFLAKKTSNRQTAKIKNETTCDTVLKWIATVQKREKIII